MELWNHFCPGCMREIKENKAVGIGKDEGNAEKSAGRGHGRTDFRCPYCGFSESGYKQNPRCLPLNTILAGKYLVGKVLGEGGFGITYMGYDLNMKTRIAIKEYFPVELVSRDTTRLTSPDGRPVSGGGSDRVISLSGEKSKTYQQGLKKYVDEARNVSQFAGIPGIVSVKDFFYENDTAYIVMEYIEGVSLKEYLRQKGGQLSEEEALAIMRPMLEALEKVHAAGIVHRDISPDNIMLTFGEQGMAKQGKAEQPPATNTVSAPSTAASAAVYGDIAAVRLIDFGAARMTSKNDQKSLTIILKHGYAPEEQYRSHGEQGPWTDVYALCAVLYRMLTGKVPEPAMDRLFADGLKRPEELGVKVTPAVSEAIMRGLAVKKEDRIQSVRELMDALYAGKRLKKRGNGKLSRPALAAALAAGVLVVILAAGITGALRTGHGTAGRNAASGQNTTNGQNADSRNTEGLPGAQNPADAGNPGQNSDKDALAEENTLVLEEETEEEDWEILVTRTPQTSGAAGGSHAVFVREDGTVASCGSNTFGQRNLSEWSRVAAVATGDSFTAGLRENGTVLVAGELEGKDDVERWENVTAISASEEHLLGLTADGKILANIDYSGMDAGENTDFTEWENIRAISAGLYVMAALTEDGRVLTVGFDGWTPAEISGWEDVTALACSQRIVYGLTEDGSVKAADMWSNQPPYERIEGIEELQNLVQIGADITSVYGVTADGKPCLAGQEYETQEAAEIFAGWNSLFCLARANDTGSMAGLGTDGSLIKGNTNYGTSTPEEMTGITRVEILSGLDSYGTALIGMTEDNRFITYGDNRYVLTSQLTAAEQVSQIVELEYMDSVGLSYSPAWLDGDGTLYMEKDFWIEPVLEGCVQIVPGNKDQIYCICALMENGTVKVLSAEYEGTLPDGIREAAEWNGITQLAGCSDRFRSDSIILGLKEDGTVVSAATSGFSQMPEGDWTQIDSLYSGDYAIGAIRKDGTARFLEDGPEYNYGQYNTSGWTDLIQLALGQFHTAGLRSDGTVYATGRNDDGQCDVEGWTDMVWIAAGPSCTVGVRADGTLEVAGEIGW